MTFKKEDLKTGMVVELRDGTKHLVIVGEFDTHHSGAQKNCFLNESSYNTDHLSQRFKSI